MTKSTSVLKTAPQSAMQLNFLVAKPGTGAVDGVAAGGAVVGDVVVGCVVGRGVGGVVGVRTDSRVIRGRFAGVVAVDVVPFFF